LTEQEAVLELSKIVEPEVLVDLLTKEPATVILDKLMKDILDLL
jgi:hypothetical protein